MTHERSIHIKTYLSELFAPEDAVLSSIRQEKKQTGLKNIEISPLVGKLLYCLALLHQSKRILEIGTLAGYSAIWLARALPPQGLLISLEINPLHVSLAKNHIARAHLEEKVSIRQGDANTLMQSMIETQEPPFDLIFIDADKENYLSYLEKALLLARPGTLIITDNLIPKGEIGKAHPNHTEAPIIYAFNQAIASHPRLESVLIPTIIGEERGLDAGRLDALGISIVKQVT
jgi:predicted O-methyltransferase YrrM